MYNTIASMVQDNPTSFIDDPYEYMYDIIAALMKANKLPLFYEYDLEMHKVFGDYDDAEERIEWLKHNTPNNCWPFKDIAEGKNPEATWFNYYRQCLDTYRQQGAGDYPRWYLRIKSFAYDIAKWAISDIVRDNGLELD